MTGVSPAHLTGMIMGMVTSFSPNWTRDWKSQLSSFSLRTGMIVYLSFLGALLPMVYWAPMTAVVRRGGRAGSRAACGGGGGGAGGGGWRGGGRSAGGR